ncbi:MAG: hypothetical protein EGR23_04540, partial [Holdemanella biformis]|nr:hypothetical protein [Holdemanella biformis]
FEITSGTIKAKSVKKESGLTIEATKKVDMPSDALRPEAYDGDKTTSTGDLKSAVKIKVDESMGGKSAYIYGRVTKGLSLVDKDGKITPISGFANNTTPAGKEIQLPENIVEIIFPAYTPYSLASDVYEIRPYSEAVISNTKYYPTLTEYGVEQGYNEVTISYFPTSAI